MTLVVTRHLSAAEQRRINRRAAAGDLRPVYAGIYTDDLVTPMSVIIRREIYTLCAILAPEAVISHRSAMQSNISPSGDYFLTGPYRRVIGIGDVRIKMFSGPSAIESDTRIPTIHGPIYRSSEARAILENLQRTRTLDGDSRVMNRADLEDLIERKLSIHGEDVLNRIRDQAREISEVLGFRAEFEQFDQIVGMLFRTRPNRAIGPMAAARAAGRPYDGQRVDLFDKLLVQCDQDSYSVPPVDPHLDPNLMAFIESYFSNYIEGTEFELEEAHDIVLTGRPVAYREDDSHDIIGTYEAILAALQTPFFPETYAQFVEQLKAWNRKVIQSREVKKPGEFKEQSNRAGNTVFVDPALTAGTLEKGYERIMAASPGVSRAAMAMFVVSEVHPFADGNGRTARLAMNQALLAAGLTRIIIPTVIRDDYLLSLKAVSNSGNATPYLRMLSRAASFSRWLDLSSLQTTFKQIHESNALLDPAEGRLTFSPIQNIDIHQGDEHEIQDGPRL